MEFHTNPMQMRIVEPLSNGDSVTTYFELLELNGKYYYIYDEVNVGPYDTPDEAVNAATEDLVKNAEL